MNFLDVFDKNQMNCRSYKKKLNLTVKNLKDHEVIAKYRDFYWSKLGIDPTKQRPANEALVRRVIKGKGLYRINWFVDGYNWASIKSMLPISAYDLESIELPVVVRMAKKGEKLG